MSQPTTPCGINEGTHYNGCECRERYVASLEQENERLRGALEYLEHVARNALDPEEQE